MKISFALMLAFAFPINAEMLERAWRASEDADRAMENVWNATEDA